jgi:hypothetical protein
MGDWRSTIQSTAAALGQTLKTVGEASVRGASEASRASADLYQRHLGENADDIFTECLIVTDILKRRRVFESDPEVFSRLYNARVRPAMAAAIVAGAGLGVEAFDETISRVTRHIFDGHELVGGWASERVAALIGDAKLEAVNRAMDTVPGTGVAGGGWLHRIQHGHDLSALVDIYREHGSEGLIQAAYHVFGRDFFTPAGIPILPDSSEALHTFLSGELGLGSLAAADLISINFIEALARVAIIVALSVLVSYADVSELKRLAERASAAAEAEDYLTAAALFEEALALRPQEGCLSFGLGMAKCRLGDRLDAFLRFRDAVTWFTADEPEITLGGATLSLRGIAAGMALSAIDAPARSTQHAHQWTDQATQITRAGLTAFQTVAAKLLSHRLRPRFYISAALNYYLAGRLAGGALYLPQREALLGLTQKNCDDALQKAEVSGLAPGRTDEVGFIRRFVAAELLPIQAPA